MVTCAHLGVMWPDCFSLVTHVATTVMSQQGLVHQILTVHLIKIGNKIAIIVLVKQIKINQNVLIRWYFENTNDLQWINSLILNTPVFYLIFVIIVLIRMCFLKLWTFKEEFKLNNGTFQINNHLKNSASISSYSYLLIFFSLLF